MAKKAKAKRQKAQPSVLGSLPAQRPERLGGRRATRAQAAPEAEAVPPSRTRAATAKPRRATASPASEKPRRGKAAAASGPQPAAAPAAEPRVRRPAPPPPPRPARRPGPPRGTELVTTAIQAAGELAQIGLTAGGRAVKRAVDRIPRP